MHGVSVGKAIDENNESTGWTKNGIDLLSDTTADPSDGPLLEFLF